MLDKKFAETPIERLERECNDDFHLLQELGASSFETAHLLEMHKQAKDNLDNFNRKIRLAMLLGVTSTGWALLGILSGGMDFFYVALFAFGMMLLSLVGFAVVLVFLKKRFESKGELVYNQKIIEDELKKRIKQQPKKFS